jgi:hypothetical protein
LHDSTSSPERGSTRAEDDIVRGTLSFRAKRIRAPSRQRRVIFLDIDGVLAPIVDRDRYGDLDPACVQVLNEIVARGGADVVVSSTWRFGKTVAEMQQVLEEYGFTGRVVDKTPTDTRGRTRGEEIAAWLAEHPVDGCVILDDHRDMGPLLPHLMQTQSATGLQPSDADRALEKLVGQMLRASPLDGAAVR